MVARVTASSVPMQVLLDNVFLLSKGFWWLDQAFVGQGVLDVLDRLCRSSDSKMAWLYLARLILRL